MKKIDLKHIRLLAIELLAVVLLSLYFSSSFVTNNRRLKKFVSRFNAGEYACASTYIYPDDRIKLAFFANEVRMKVPHAFIEIEHCETKDGYVVAKLKWKNANDFLRNYFANVGKPLSKGDILVDTLGIKETLDGECFSFDWGSPKVNTEKLRLASISAEDIEWMNIRTDTSTNSQIIGKLRKGNDILIEDAGQASLHRARRASTMPNGHIPLPGYSKFTVLRSISTPSMVMFTVCCPASALSRAMR